MRFLLPLFACLLLTAAETVPPPLPSPAEAMARQASALAEQHKRFFDWALVDAFRRAGGQQAWRADAERFLSDLARHLATGQADEQMDALIAAGRRVLSAGCDDPLVRLRVGMLLGGTAEGARLVTASIEGLRAHPGVYPALHLVSALRRQVDPQRRTLAAAVSRELPEVIATACREALAASCPRAVAIDRLVDWVEPVFQDGGLGKDDTARALTALEAPGGDRVLAGVLRGQAAIRAAWEARGGGWANSVTKEGWAGFRAGLAEARRSLTAAWQELPASAVAASQMITVAMGDDADSPGVWFERALAADPGCLDAWQRIASATLPRWGGSTGQLMVLAKRAVAGARPGNRLDQAAANALACFVGEDGDETAAWEQIGRLDAVCPLAFEPGRQLRALGVAWHAGKKAEALELYARLGGLAAPMAALEAAPFAAPVGGMRLLILLERARLGQPVPAVRPIPADGAAHSRAVNVPTVFSLLPAMWKAHGQHDPAWDARITALLEKVASTGADPSAATDLVAAGCPDPLVRYLACNEQATRPSAWRRSELQACWDAVEAAGYPPVAVWQPAWFLLKNLYQDKAAAADCARLLPRFAALAAKLAASTGVEGTTAGLILAELGDPPASDPALLKLIDGAAAAPGVAPALGSGLTGLTAMLRAQRLGQHDPQRRRLAWTALSRLWPAWIASHHPRAAAVMAHAASLAGLPSEARLWFDEAVRLAYDDSMPWDGLCAGYADIGAPDELLAFAAEIAALPTASGATLRAINPVHSVLSNRWLHTPGRLKSAWATIDRATRGLVDAPALGAESRSVLQYWRLACAALAGDQPAAIAAAKSLGAPFDPKRLPQGIDPATVADAVAAAAAATAPAKPSDF